MDRELVGHLFDAAVTGGGPESEFPSLLPPSQDTVQYGFCLSSVLNCVVGDGQVCKKVGATSWPFCFVGQPTFE